MHRHDQRSIGRSLRQDHHKQKKTLMSSICKIVFLVVLAFGLLPARLVAQPGSASLVSSTYLTTANTGPINPPQFTLEARIQPTGPGYGRTETGVGAVVISKPRQGATGSPLESWALYWSPVTQRAAFVVTHVFGVSGSGVTSNAVIGIGQSAHIAGTFDGTTLRLYINGVLDNSAPAVSSVVYYGATEPVLIGAGNYAFGFTRRFQGRIDDVRIWDVARSAADIAAKAVCQLPSGPQSNLLAHWTFDSNSPADQSGNNRNASFVDGSPAFGSDLAQPCGGCSLADIAGGGPDGRSPDFIVDGSDFIAFINSFGTGDPTVDPLADVAGGGNDGLRPDGIIDGNDFIAFINAFAAGC